MQFCQLVCLYIPFSRNVGKSLMSFTKLASLQGAGADPRAHHIAFLEAASISNDPTQWHKNHTLLWLPEFQLKESFEISRVWKSN